MQKKQKVQLNIKYGQIDRVLLGIVVLLFSFFSSTLFVENTLAEEKNSNSYANLEREIINQLNQERAEAHLNSLMFSPELKKGADIKMLDIIKNKYFAHTSPRGTRAWDILRDINYDYKYAGENLAMKFEDAVSVHRAWMKSEKHRENILFKNYTEVAVSVGQKDDGDLVAVEFFGKPMINVTGNGRMITNETRGDIKTMVNRKNIELLGIANSDREMGSLFTQMVPSNKIDKKRTFEVFSLRKLSPDQVMSLNNLILLAVGIVCLILVVNIWVLEKEDERIIAEAKMLCNN